MFTQKDLWLNFNWRSVATKITNLTASKHAQTADRQADLFGNRLPRVV